MKMPGNNEDWAKRGEVAMKAGAMLSVLSIIAVVVTHATVRLEDPEAIVEAPAVSTVAEQKPYYFPSQFELNAPANSGEPAPTF